MSKSHLDRRSKNILNYRPNIAYVEPPTQELPPPSIPFGLQPQDAEARVQKVKSLADAVNVLATAVQAKVDTKAANIVIKLDPIVDAATISAMQRAFPDADPNSISYDQYRAAKDQIRLYADKVAQKPHVSPDAIAAAKQQLNAGTTQIGGWGTPEAANGLLRPELEPLAQVVEPLDVNKFQNYLIRILVNFIWKHFIRPILKAAIPLGGGNLLPKQLVSLPKNFKKQMDNIKAEGVQTL